MKGVKIEASDLHKEFVNYVKEVMKDAPLDNEKRTELVKICSLLFFGFLKHMEETEHVEDLDLNDIDLLGEA